MSNRAVTYTTAPATLDWLFTKELDPNVGTTRKGERVRAVETGSLWPAQRKRYELEGYLADGEEGWARLLASGRAKLRTWHKDDTYLTFLRVRGLASLSDEAKELVYHGYQAGRLLSTI